MFANYRNCASLDRRVDGLYGAGNYFVWHLARDTQSAWEGLRAGCRLAPLCDLLPACHRALPGFFLSLVETPTISSLPRIAWTGALGRVTDLFPSPCFYPVGTAGAGQDVFRFHFSRSAVVYQPPTGNERAVCYRAQSHVSRVDHRRRGESVALPDLDDGRVCDLRSLPAFSRPPRGADTVSGVRRSVAGLCSPRADDPTALEKKGVEARER